MQEKWIISTQLTILLTDAARLQHKKQSSAKRTLFLLEKKSCVKPPVIPDEDAAFLQWKATESLKVKMLTLWLSRRPWVNLSLEVSWWRSVCVCLKDCWSTLPIYSKPADMKFIRLKLLHSCDPHAEWIPSLSSWCCPGNHLNACHWRCCSVNRESEHKTESWGWGKCKRMAGGGRKGGNVESEITLGDLQ